MPLFIFVSCFFSAKLKILEEQIFVFIETKNDFIQDKNKTNETL